MTPATAAADYQLVWPRQLFQREAAELLTSHSTLADRLADWDARCELLLEDAFTGTAPRDDFLAEPAAPRGKTFTDRRKDFLLKLLRRAPSLTEKTTGRRPYWSERQLGERPGAVSLSGTVREFLRVVNQLDCRGYFEKAFDKDCVDDPSDPERPSALLVDALGVPDLWPLRHDRLASDQDLFCDVVEALHDLAARPRMRTHHGYSSCGWHHSAFSLDAGQVLYRWRVNQVLDRSELGLRLADEGEDTGRLVASTDLARTGLLAAMATRADPATGDDVRHAIALFRARAATDQDKRSAVISLAGVLENRRPLLKTELARKDEGALFQIANEFAIRHRNKTQKGDYDPAFLDWVFWWYLATIELTDRLLARISAAPVVSPLPHDQPAWEDL